LIEIRHIVSVEPDFRCEELGIQHRIFIARAAVQPGKVAICEWRKIVDSLRWLRRL
jgi:hypothetical protein